MLKKTIFTLTFINTISSFQLDHETFSPVFNQIQILNQNLAQLKNFIHTKNNIDKSIFRNFDNDDLQNDVQNNVHDCSEYIEIIAQYDEKYNELISHYEIMISTLEGTIMTQENINKLDAMSWNDELEKLHFDTEHLFGWGIGEFTRKKLFICLILNKYLLKFLKNGAS